MHDCLSAQDWIKAWEESGTDGRPFEAGLPVDDESIDCPRCMEELERVYALIDDLEHFDPAIAPEVLAADELFTKLARLTPPERLARVTEDVRYRQWGLVQRLLRESRELWRSDVEEARDLARVAVAVADLLDPEAYHPQWVADLRAKSYAYLANTFRVLGDFDRAERKFLTAEHHLRRGVGSGRCRAEVFSLKASLLVDEDRFVEAGALLEGVADYYRQADDSRALARIHLQLAMVAAGQGEFRRAAAACDEACSDLDPTADRALVALARQNAVSYLVQAGDVLRARRAFDGLPRAEERSAVLRRQWVEGDLLRVEGRLTESLDAYRAARQGYAEEGRHYYMALLALEEALVSFDLGDTAELTARAEEASVLLVKAAAPHQALATLRVLLAAIERGAVDRALLAGVARRVAALKPS